MLSEGGEAGDAGHVLIVWTRGHVPQRLQLPLRAVVTHVAVEHRGCVGARGQHYCDKLGEYKVDTRVSRVRGYKDVWTFQGPGGRVQSSRGTHYVRRV